VHSAGEATRLLFIINGLYYNINARMTKEYNYWIGTHETLGQGREVSGARSGRRGAGR